MKKNTKHTIDRVETREKIDKRERMNKHTTRIY